MNTPAIHHAIRLKKHPEEMAWLCYADSDLPEGVTDLLRIYSSTELITAFAEKNMLDLEELSSSILHFIQKVIVNENNSDAKILGTDQFSSLQLQSFHYEMLINIFSDTQGISSAENKQHSTIIKNAYQRLQQKHLDQGVISFSEHRKASKNYYSNHKAESSLSYFKTAVAAISTIGIFILVAMAGNNIEPPTTALAKENTQIQEEIITDSNSTAVDPQRLVKISTNQSTSIDKKVLADNASRANLQLLLKGLESAYENGDVQTIMPILANAPSIKKQTNKQLHDKLETLFGITNERKMVLFDFDWNNFSGKIQGKGKFLSRYQLVGEKDWITREGDASVTAQFSENKLKITQLILENSID